MRFYRPGMITLDHLYLRLPPLLAPFPPYSTHLVAILEELEVCRGTRESPELNLNRKVEVKRCSETGNQQAHQPRSTFARSGSLSLVSNPSPLLLFIVDIHSCFLKQSTCCVTSRLDSCCHTPFDIII